MSKPLWVGWVEGYRDVSYIRWGRAASLHFGPLCIQWRMPYKPVFGAK